MTAYNVMQNLTVNTKPKAEWMHSNQDLAINYNSSLKSSGLLFSTGSRGNFMLGRPLSRCAQHTDTYCKIKNTR